MGFKRRRQYTRFIPKPAVAFEQEATEVTEGEQGALRSEAVVNLTQRVM